MPSYGNALAIGTGQMSEWLLALSVGSRIDRVAKEEPRGVRENPGGQPFTYDVRRHFYDSGIF